MRIAEHVAKQHLQHSHQSSKSLQPNRRNSKETISKSRRFKPKKNQNLFLEKFDRSRKKNSAPVFLDARRSAEFQEIDKIRLQNLFRPVSGVDHRALISR